MTTCGSSLPFTANPWWLFGVFACLTLLFHLLFLKVWRLGKIAWKRADYVWLAMAAFGLIGASVEVRRLTATSVIDAERVSLAYSYQTLRDRVRFMTGGAVCRKFVRSDFSPPNFDSVQREYDDACSFATRAYSNLSVEAPEDFTEAKLPARPRVTDVVLIELFTELDAYWKDYERAALSLQRVRAATALSATELALAKLSPLFFAIALALRITKVTGEVSLEAHRPGC